ncbi:protein-glutamate methyltransferase [Sphingomonas sp. AP4-R1]|uniref:CheR family methyltransferase n=1 Tax=Sphingomonas sp. AP4-R1 TaxID=2735134 RepID=UPI0014939745|nr:protein-glutamate O-methyltransferase CheR [Sphingomonas sp. AP4-R1]QJU56942.1 protein-glutamate methyltransferase [Sphingomonas sp. AP4-R1]
MSHARRTLAPVDDPAFAAIKALIVTETGHHYYEDKDGQLAEKIGRRMAAIGIADPGLYLERLRDPAMGPREWRQLESELTIKETFFFRFAEQFAALRAHILPAMIARHAEDRHLRIWSAGCSTGAEPYSLAVLIHDLLGEKVGDWSVSILGTDLDEGALADARAALYGGWALRAVEPAERARLFQPEKDRWRLKAAYRGMVRFERQNLLDLLDPAPAIGRNNYDLILCRNLLIYFRPDVGVRLVSALGARLATHGKLLLGHAETGLAAESDLAPVELDGIVAYVRDDARPAGEAEGPGAPEPAPPPRPRPPLPPRRAPRTVPRRLPATPPPSRPPEPAPSSLDEVRLLLGQGETQKARLAIGALKGERGSDPVLFYLDGLGALAEQDHAGAEKALRGALYLDQGFVMAHYLLGRHLLREGREQEGRRALGNAAEAVATTDPYAPVPEGEGLTAADLRQAIRHWLSGAGGTGA